MRTLMIQSYYQAGDLQAASREALEDVHAAEKAGRAPPEDRLQLLANVASKSGDRGAYVSALESWLPIIRSANTGPTCCAGSNPSPDSRIA